MKEKRPSSWLIDPEQIMAWGLIQSAQSGKGCNEEMRQEVLGRLPKTSPLREILLEIDNNNIVGKEKKT